MVDGVKSGRQIKEAKTWQRSSQWYVTTLQWRRLGGYLCWSGCLGQWTYSSMLPLSWHCIDMLMAQCNPCKIGTCKASWFDSISNRASDSIFDSYWWSDSKFSICPRCQSSFVKKRLVVVKFAFKVDFGSKKSVQQHCLTRFMGNWNKQVLSSEFRSPYITLVRHKYYIIGL